MRNAFVVLLSLASGYCVATPTPQADSFPAQILVAGKPLVLNGVGMREATVFKVDVYEGGLYLEKATSDAEAAIAQPRKRIEMRFKREVDRKKLAEGWKEGWQRNCENDCGTYLDGITAMGAKMEDMKEGETITITFLPEAVEIQVKGGAATKIGDAAFAKFLPRLWLGNPPNPELKQGMLGLEKK